MTASLCAVVSSLEPADRERLLDRAVPRRLRRTESLCLAGDRSERVHLVTDGVLKLTGRNGGGAETIVGLAVPGDIVGDVAALDGLAQPFDVVAAVDASVLGFAADLFLDVVLRSPRASEELARKLAERNRSLGDALLERGTGNVPARLAGRLLELADVLGRVDDGAVAVELPFAQGDLGRLAGMSRESACKTLRHFKKNGVLDYEGRRLRILRPDVLERIRCASRG